MGRSALILLAIGCGAPAAAEMAPGPPPWSCHVAMACDAAACIPLPGTFAALRVEAGPDGGTLLVDGRPAPVFAAREEAEAAVAAGAIPRDAALVLVRDDAGLGDAVGLSLYAPSSRGGSAGLSDTHAALVCTGAL